MSERLSPASYLLAISLLAVILTAGCIGQTAPGTGGISISALADPPAIRSDEGTTLIVDIENRDTADFIKVFVEAFDTGPFSAVRAPSIPALQGQPSEPCTCPTGTECKGDETCGPAGGCFTTIYGLRPAEIRSLECALVLRNPASIIQDTTANIQLRTFFRKSLQVSQTLQFLTLEEFRRQETLGSLQSEPQSFSGSDQNLQISVSYSKQPPFVAGEKILMQLAISSVGSGTVYTLNPGDIGINQSGDKIKCGPETTLRSDRGAFAPITCEIGVGQLSGPIETYPFAINVYYDYEVRQSLPISIQKVSRA